MFMIKHKHVTNCHLPQEERLSQLLILEIDANISSDELSQVSKENFLIGEQLLKITLISERKLFEIKVFLRHQFQILQASSLL